MRLYFMLLASCLFLANVLPRTCASAQAQGEGVYDVADLDEKLQATNQESPVYPIGLKRNGLNGEVRLCFVIDKRGSVRNPFVVGSSDPAFERPAIEAVLKWKFKPGKKGGEVVVTRIEQTLTFNVDGGSPVPWQVAVTRYHNSLPPELRWETPPKLRGTDFPVYPFEALKKGARGKTQMNFLVGPTGEVMGARLIEATTPEMGLAALAMIDAWRFDPARKKDGTPCYATIIVGHEFAPKGLGGVPVSESARDILRTLDEHPERIVAIGQLDHEPRALSLRSAIYPSALRKVGQPGEALIEYYIDRNGDAQLPRVISASAPEFGYAAAQAVATWRYEAPLKDGKPVIARAQKPVTFKSPQEEILPQAPAAREKRP